MGVSFYTKTKGYKDFPELKPVDDKSFTFKGVLVKSNNLVHNYRGFLIQK